MAESRQFAHRALARRVLAVGHAFHILEGVLLLLGQVDHVLSNQFLSELAALLLRFYLYLFELVILEFGTLFVCTYRAAVFKMLLFEMSAPAQVGVLPRLLKIVQEHHLKRLAKLKRQSAGFAHPEILLAGNVHGLNHMIQIAADPRLMVVAGAFRALDANAVIVEEIPQPPLIRVRDQR